MSAYILFVGFDCGWPLCAMPKRREYSLAPGSPQNGVSAQAKMTLQSTPHPPKGQFNSCVSFMLTNTLRLMPCFYCSSPAPGASDTERRPPLSLWLPLPMGKICSCDGHHPACTLHAEKNLADGALFAQPG